MGVKRGMQKKKKNLKKTPTNPRVSRSYTILLIVLFASYKEKSN